jgi:membrane-bound lytic murein transglycosylase B
VTPEDLREVISAYQKCVVQRFGGFVAKYMGDGVLVYFGYPQAHEDDAERAVRAGLDVIQAVGGFEVTAAGFEAWKRQFAGEAQARGVSASAIAALMGTTYSTATIAADRGQRSFSLSLDHL